MAQKTLDADLNVIQNAGLEIHLLDGDLNIIQKLDDEPNDVGGMTAQELKAKFDEAGNTIKKFINESLVPECLSEGVVENQRKANETARQENEAQRQSAETDRASAEEGRASQETARQSAESARGTAEDARASAESGRASAEQGRVSAEASRADAESAREDAEDARKEAEAAREATELDRALTETGRASAEAARVSAEASRVDTETARASAEALRQTAFQDAQEERAEVFDDAQAARQTAFNAAEAERAASFLQAEALRQAGEQQRQANEAARELWEDYDPGHAYVPGNKVCYLGSSYVCVAPVSGLAPADTAHWQLVAAKGQDGDGAGVSPEQMNQALALKQDKIPGKKGQVVGFTATGGLCGMDLPEAVTPGQLEEGLAGKQDKFSGEAGQVVGFDADGNAVPQDAPVTGMTEAQADGRYLQLTGGTLSGKLNVGNNLRVDRQISFYRPGSFMSVVPSDFTGYALTAMNVGVYIDGKPTIFEVAAPSNDVHAANKGYVDSAIQTALEGDIDAKTAEKLLTPRSIQVNLASNASSSFNGTADITPGVTGTLPVSRGGTGQTSMTDTVYTTTKYRGISFASSAPSSVTNGCVVLVYV